MHSENTFILKTIEYRGQGEAEMFWEHNTACVYNSLYHRNSSSFPAPSCTQHAPGLPSLLTMTSLAPCNFHRFHKILPPSCFACVLVFDARSNVAQANPTLLTQLQRTLNSTFQYWGHRHTPLCLTFLSQLQETGQRGAPCIAFLRSERLPAAEVGLSQDRVRLLSGIHVSFVSSLPLWAAHESTEKGRVSSPNWPAAVSMKRLSFFNKCAQRPF